MGLFPLFVLVLITINISNCDVALRILRITDQNYTPVTKNVEEEIGKNFSLACELWSTNNDTFFDDEIRWGKSSSTFFFKTDPDLEPLVKKRSKKLNSMFKDDDNRPIKQFFPLKLEDEGTYFCLSLKYSLFRIIHVYVRGVSVAEKKYPFNFNHAIVYCNEKMFRCKNTSLEICIYQRYVCDGRADCRDGSDEDVDICNGDPCQDKIRCEDGRCIPTSLCCDPYRDVDCKAKYRPACCQQLTDYSEDSVNIYSVQMGSGRAKTRYIFISLCALATFFAIALMILILSKIYIFAKKPSTCIYNGNIYHLNDLPEDLLHHNGSNGGLINGNNGRIITGPNGELLSTTTTTNLSTITTANSSDVVTSNNHSPRRGGTVPLYCSVNYFSPNGHRLLRRHHPHQHQHLQQSPPGTSPQPPPPPSSFAATLRHYVTGATSPPHNTTTTTTSLLSSPAAATTTITRMDSPPPCYSDVVMTATTTATTGTAVTDAGAAGGGGVMLTGCGRDDDVPPPPYDSTEMVNGGGGGVVVLVSGQVRVV